MITLAPLGPHAHMLSIGKLRVLFSYDQPVAFITDEANALGRWVRVPDDGLTKATRRHLELHVPTGWEAPDHADFLHRLELALRMIRLG